MKKIIFLFVMLLTVTMSKAEDITVDLTATPTTSGDGVTWDSANKQLTITNGTSGGYAQFAVDGVDKYTSVAANIAELSGNVKIFLIGEDGGKYNLNAGVENNLFGSAGTKYLVSNCFGNIGHIVGVRIQNVSSAALTIKLNSITFKFANVANTNTMAFTSLPTQGTWPGTNNLSNLPLAISSNYQYIGYAKDASETSTSWADISAVRAIIIKITNHSVTGGGKIMAAVRPANGSKTNYFANPISNTSVADWTAECSITGDGYYYIDVSNCDYLYGIKSNNYGTASTFTVDQIYLISSFLDLQDGSDLGPIVDDPVKSTVLYNRAFTADRKATVCFPFALSQGEADEAGTFYEYVGVTDGKLQFDAVTSEGTKAYKPYIFKPKADGAAFSCLTAKEIVATPATAAGYATTDDKHNYTFQGVLAHQTVDSGVFGFDSADGVFKKAITSDITIDAFRAYIKAGTSAHSLDVVFNDGDVTGIKNITPALKQAEGARYNLQGQRVSEGHKGLVIMNGKKVVMK